MVLIYYGVIIVVERYDASLALLHGVLGCYISSTRLPRHRSSLVSL